MKKQKYVYQVRSDNNGILFGTFYSKKEAEKFKDNANNISVYKVKVE